MRQANDSAAADHHALGEQIGRFLTGADTAAGGANGSETELERLRLLAGQRRSIIEMFCTLFVGAPVLPPRAPFVDLGVEATKAQLLALGVPPAVYAVAAAGGVIERQVVDVAHSFGIRV